MHTEFFEDGVIGLIASEKIELTGGEEARTMHIVRIIQMCFNITPRTNRALSTQQEHTQGERNLTCLPERQKAAVGRGTVGKAKYVRSEEVHSEMN